MYQYCPQFNARLLLFNSSFHPNQFKSYKKQTVFSSGRENQAPLLYFYMDRCLHYRKHGKLCLCALMKLNFQQPVSLFSQRLCIVCIIFSRLPIRENCSKQLHYKLSCLRCFCLLYKFFLIDLSSV